MPAAGGQIISDGRDPSWVRPSRSGASLGRPTADHKNRSGPTEPIADQRIEVGPAAKPSVDATSRVLPEGRPAELVDGLWQSRPVNVQVPGFSSSAAERLPPPPFSPAQLEPRRESPLAPLSAPSLAASSAEDDLTWRMQVLPSSIMYRPYLASQQESRMALQWVRVRGQSNFLDGWLGGRFGIFRYGDSQVGFPQGWQLDFEGAAQVRLNQLQDLDVESTDYRAGVPLAYAWGRHQTKLAYYHISSHLGDEFLLRSPDYPRLNYVRDCITLGHSYYPTDRLRLYAEAGWAFFNDVADRWEFQFGIEAAPRFPTGRAGAPFWAVHGYLLEELSFGGGLAAQAGWAWRSNYNSGLLRLGVQYYNGPSPQYSFYNVFEQQIGAGLWYDF
jgi:hypothetical protein